MGEVLANRELKPKEQALWDSRTPFWLLTHCVGLQYYLALI